MLNLKDVAKMLEGIDFQQMNDSMTQMNNKLSEVTVKLSELVVLMQEAVDELAKDRPVE